jgi:hypothetical protein
VLGCRRAIWERRQQIVYIARQETLDDDWEHLKRLLRLPADAKLPSATKFANRRDAPKGDALDATAVEALRRWYREEYRLVGYCDAIRAWHGWGLGPRADGSRERIGDVRRRFAGAAAVVPPPPAAITRRLPRW